MDEVIRRAWLNRECPDGGMLQSEGWRALLGREGYPTEHFEGDGLWANTVEYRLPLVGPYWYVPRGPVVERSESIATCESRLAEGHVWRSILNRAKDRGARWVRVDPADDRALEMIREWSKPYEMRRSRHDMQPREILVLDISRSSEAILSEMKPKTRYNIRLAEKRGVSVSLDRGSDALNAFLRLVGETSRRNGILPHREAHYRAFLEAFPVEQLELFVARYNEAAVAAIMVSFFGDTATYLHGGSAGNDRNSMASALIQFRAIEEAKRRGCRRYDLGGIDTLGMRPALGGVTRFKLGFAKSVKPILYPGSFDIVLVPSRFFGYTLLSVSKEIIRKASRALTKA